MPALPLSERAGRGSKQKLFQFVVSYCLLRPAFAAVFPYSGHHLGRFKEINRCFGDLDEQLRSAADCLISLQILTQPLIITKPIKSTLKHASSAGVFGPDDAV